jgi:hypothetical protein
VSSTQRCRDPSQAIWVTTTLTPISLLRAGPVPLLRGSA